MPGTKVWAQTGEGKFLRKEACVRRNINHANVSPVDAGIAHLRGIDVAAHDSGKIVLTRTPIPRSGRAGCCNNLYINNTLFIYSLILALTSRNKHAKRRGCRESCLMLICKQEFRMSWKMPLSTEKKECVKPWAQGCKSQTLLKPGPGPCHSTLQPVRSEVSEELENGNGSDYGFRIVMEIATSSCGYWLIQHFEEVRFQDRRDRIFCVHHLKTYGTSSAIGLVCHAMFPRLNCVAGHRLVITKMPKTGFQLGLLDGLDGLKNTFGSLQHVQMPAVIHFSKWHYVHLGKPLHESLCLWGRLWGLPCFQPRIFWEPGKSLKIEAMVEQSLARTISYVSPKIAATNNIGNPSASKKRICNAVWIVPGLKTINTILLNVEPVEWTGTKHWKIVDVSYHLNWCSYWWPAYFTNCSGVTACGHRTCEKGTCLIPNARLSSCRSRSRSSSRSNHASKAVFLATHCW